MGLEDDPFLLGKVTFQGQTVKLLGGYLPQLRWQYGRTVPCRVQYLFSFSSWWLDQPILKDMFVKLDHLPRNSGWKIKNHQNHHIDNICYHSVIQFFGKPPKLINWSTDQPVTELWSKVISDQETRFTWTDLDRRIGKNPTVDGFWYLLEIKHKMFG